MMHVDLVAIAGMFTAVSIILGIPLVRSYTKRMEAGLTSRSAPSDVSRRLERIEQAIDAMAIEVERISEGQRFTTRLLAARADGTSSNGAVTNGAIVGGAASQRPPANADQFPGDRR